MRVHTDAEADMVLAEASTAICVQRFDDSRNSAIHTTYRISLRSSSLREPRYPLLRVVFVNRSAMPARVSFRQTDWLGVWKKLADPNHRRIRGPVGPRARPPRPPRGQCAEGYGIVREWMWMDSMILPQVHLVTSSQGAIAGRARLAPCSITLYFSELSGP